MNFTIKYGIELEVIEAFSATQLKTKKKTYGTGRLFCSIKLYLEGEGGIFAWQQYALKGILLSVLQIFISFHNETLQE